MTLKEKVYSHYLKTINDKIQLLQYTLSDLKESGSNETKSTAADKHETALAMLQIEQENKRTQLSDALTQKAALEKINPIVAALRIISGSLVKTNRGFFFISIALGKAFIDGTSVIAISPQSPLGMQLMGSQVGDSLEINTNRYVIESIS